MSHTPFDAIAARIARTTYVILLKDDRGRTTLLADPGMGQPWHSGNKRLADFHARECGGEAHTWESAFAILRKEAPDLEKVLYDRAAKRAMRGRSSPFPKNPKNN